MSDVPPNIGSDAAEPDSGVALQVKDLTQIYKGGSIPALASFNLSVQYGDIFGLLGPNGAGKTTAIAVMSTLIKPTSGTVQVCGTDALRHARRVRRQIGVVPQDIALFDALTATENLIYFGRLYGLKGQLLKSAVAHGLDVAGISERSREPIKNFSGGMKRRLNLAVGILHRPRLLFLDEPTVGIDAQSRNSILENLILLKEQGTTMIYTTHYMEEAQRICTQLAVMDKGSLIAQNHPRGLLEAHPDCADLGELFLKLTGRQLRD